MLSQPQRIFLQDRSSFYPSPTGWPAGRGIHNRPWSLGDRGPAFIPRSCFAKYSRFPTPAVPECLRIKAAAVNATAAALSWIINRSYMISAFQGQPPYFMVTKYNGSPARRKGFISILYARLQAPGLSKQIHWTSPYGVWHFFTLILLFQKLNSFCPAWASLLRKRLLTFNSRSAKKRRRAHSS